LGLDLQRVNALLPADATGAFVAIQAAINQFQGEAQLFAAILTFAVIAAIALFLPIYLRFVLSIRDAPQRFFLVATFVIWSLSITAEAHFTNVFDAIGIGDAEPFFIVVLRVVVLFWTFLVLPIAAAYVHSQMQPSPVPPVQPAGGGF